MPLPESGAFYQRRRRRLSRALKLPLFILLICLCISIRQLYENTWLGQYSYILKLRKLCGELCLIGGGTFEDSLYFNKRTVPVSCETIFGDHVFLERGHGKAHPPKTFPFFDEYTLGGRIPVLNHYFDQKYVSTSAAFSTWTEDFVNAWVSKATNGKLEGSYGLNETLHLSHALKKAPGVHGGRVLVIGSENPWVEATVLAAGAESVVTLEYGKIFSEHPAIKTLTPKEFKRAYKAGTLGLFDAVVTFSSVEHSGLGRYGDALNPWGDVLEIARSHCVCKANGSLVIAVMGDERGDILEFNAHRLYGPLRWPYLASNWQQVFREEDGIQKVHIFSKV